MKRALLVLASLGLAALVMPFAAACDDDTGDDSAGSAEVSYNGGVVEPSFVKPQAILTDTASQPFDLRRQTEGFLTLLYVGYTHCPDICPTHLALLAEALAQLPPDVTDHTKVIFVTADPARDTPQAIRRWLDLFDKRFIGLTGPPETVFATLRDLGMDTPTWTDLGNGNYSVSHAAYILAFTTDNEAHVIYPSGITVADWLHDLPLLVKGWQPQ